MKPEQINQAIAESVFITPGHWVYYASSLDAHSGKAWMQHGWTGPDGKTYDKLPDYYHDLNAIHEVVCGLDADNQSVYVVFLQEAVGLTEQDCDNWSYDEDWILCNATAAQRCEAYLRTIGKWEDQ